MGNLLKRCLQGTYLFLLLLPTFSQAYAPQEAEAGVAASDFNQEIDEAYDLEPASNYASLTVNWGLASLLQAHKDMDLTFWRSRVAGASLYYNIPIKSSHFMVSCGAGISNVDYLFKEGKYTIGRDQENKKTTIRTTANNTDIVPTGQKAEKSSFSIWHADFIGELRFNSNKEEPQEDFFIAIGGNIGFQFLPSTSIQYKEHDENKTKTLQESFNLLKLRYGVLARIGWGRFGAFYHQTLSPLFNEKGPTTTPILPFSIGINVNLL